MFWFTTSQTSFGSRAKEKPEKAKRQAMAKSERMSQSKWSWRAGGSGEPRPQGWWVAWVTALAGGVRHALHGAKEFPDRFRSIDGVGGGTGHAWVQLCTTAGPVVTESVNRHRFEARWTGVSLHSNCPIITLQYRNWRTAKSTRPAFERFVHRWSADQAIGPRQPDFAAAKRNQKILCPNRIEGRHRTRRPRVRQPAVPRDWRDRRDTLRSLSRKSERHASAVGKARHEHTLRINLVPFEGKIDHGFQKCDVSGF